MPAHNQPRPPAPTPAPPAEESHQAPQGFDFRTLYHVVFERTWVIVLCVVLAAFGTAFYLKRAPVLYDANAVLEVQQQEDKVVKVEKVSQDDLRMLDALNTIVATLKNRTLLERVIDTNNLAKDPRFAYSPDKPLTREQLVTILGRITDVRLRRNTRLIDIRVVHTTPELTAKIGNSIWKEYMNQSVAQHVNTTEMANDFLVEESRRLKQKLLDSENALQAYVEKTGATSLKNNQDTVSAKLKEYSTRVTESKSTRIRLETDYAQVAKLADSVEALMILPVVAKDAKVVEIQMTITKLESDFANLKQRYKEQHPKYKQIASQLQEWRDAFTNAVRNAPQTLKSSLEAARTAEQALEKALQTQESAALELNKLAIRYNELNRELESDRVIYDSVLTRIRETSITKEVQPTKIRVVQQAYVPEKPFAPQKPKVIIGGLLAGFVAGILLALAVNALDSSLKTVDQVEEVIQLPVLSAVPQMREVKKGRTTLVVSEDSKSAGAEAFRTLRTSLGMLGRAEQRRVFLFTSALPQEGKTFTSINYAASLAQQGLCTVLIDCDLRRPSVEESLVGKGITHIGVTDYLTGQKKFSELVQATKVEKFEYVPAGTTAPNPAELLAQGGFHGLVQEALQHFDRVVVDSAPIHAVSDTLLIVTCAQTVCVVARAAKTPRRAIQRCVQMLLHAGAPLGGVVLNRMPRRRGPGYYYYDSYYDYSYYGKYSRKGVYGVK